MADDGDNVKKWLVLKRCKTVHVICLSVIVRQEFWSASLLSRPLLIAQPHVILQCNNTLLIILFDPSL